MTTVRIAKEENREDFYKLWKICFGDSDAFCDWFFANRFSPTHSVVLEENGEIISCMQAFPYLIRIRGKVVSGAMLCGVSTHPAHRRKGCMGKIFSYEMNHLREMGYLIAPHTPAVLPSYFSFGHLPVADAAYLQCDCVPFVEKPEGFCLLTEENWQTFYPLYTRFAEKYSGIIQRTEADFLRKATDYAADGGKAAAYIEDNSIKGYAFYYQTETELLCVEAVAEEGYWKPLTDGLLFLGKGLSFSAKLPPEVKLSYSFAETERNQKGVMGLCNAAALLQALALSLPYGFSLKDTIIPENNGLFDFCGNAYVGEPIFEISVGHLIQVLVGYHSLQELKEEITVFDEKKFAELDSLLPKQNCYIIDEY